MINEEEVLYQGYVSRARGLAGEVEINHDSNAFLDGSSDYLVLEIDGILVPFFLEEMRPKNNYVSIVKFEYYDSADSAKCLVGSRVFYPIKHLPTDEELTPFETAGISGFSVQDQHHHLVGKAVSIDDRSANILLIVETENGREIMLPLHEDLIIDYNSKERSITLQVPEGLLEI